MSRHHYTHAHEANNVTHDIVNLSVKELRDLYGIEFYEDPDSKDGRVYDPVSGKDFATLQEWGADQIQQEQWESLAQTGQAGGLTDEEISENWFRS